MNNAVDWKTRAAEVEAQIAKEPPIVGADSVLQSAYKAVVQALAQPDVLVRVTIQTMVQTRVMGDCIDILRGTQLVDLRKTKIEGEPGMPYWPTLELRNGSAIEFVTIGGLAPAQEIQRTATNERGAKADPKPSWDARFCRR